MANVCKIKGERTIRKSKRREKELEESRLALMNILEDVEEARLKAEEEKSKTLAIFANFADGLLLFDKEGRLSLVNRQAENFFAVGAQQIIGKSIDELAYLPNLKSLISLIGKEIKDVFRQEISLKEKKDIVFEVSVFPVVRHQDKIGSLVIIRDISREKGIEKMKTEFVTLAAHQLRTPLSAIKWSLRMILDGDLGQITQEQREFMEKTYKSNERMIVLINNLLDTTRIEEGRYLFKPILVDVVPIVRFVVNSYKEAAKKKNLKLSFEEPKKDFPRLILDVEKIRLAIQNLIDNSIKYNMPGGRITISLTVDRQNVIIKVKDTGVGIPEDQKSRVFSKFFRASNVLRMDTEGTGLGLFIVKNIVDAHGGKVWFESQEGGGTSFYVSLPSKEEFSEFLTKF